jgi:hypothetical protein
VHRTGVLNLLLTVDALVDGADPATAERLLTGTAAADLTRVLGWDDARSARVRRRLRAIGVVDTTGLAAGLSQLARDA